MTSSTARLPSRVCSRCGRDICERPPPVATRRLQPEATKLTASLAHAPLSATPRSPTASAPARLALTLLARSHELAHFRSGAVDATEAPSAPSTGPASAPLTRSAATATASDDVRAAMPKHVARTASQRAPTRTIVCGGPAKDRVASRTSTAATAGPTTTAAIAASEPVASATAAATTIRATMSPALDAARPRTSDTNVNVLVRDTQLPRQLPDRILDIKIVILIVISLVMVIALAFKARTLERRDHLLERVHDEIDTGHALRRDRQAWRLVSSMTGASFDQHQQQRRAGARHGGDVRQHLVEVLAKIARTDGDDDVERTGRRER